MTKFDFIRVLVNASAAAGVTAIWIEFTRKAIRMVWSLINNEPFYDSSSDWSDDDLEEEIPQIPKPMLPHYDDGSESFPEITEPPPPYQLNADYCSF